MNSKNGITLLLVFGLCLTTQPVIAQENSTYIRQVREIVLTDDTLNKHSGLTYAPAMDNFLMFQSPPSAKLGKSVAEMARRNFFGKEAGAIRLSPGVAEPLGLAVDNRASRLYLLEAASGDVIEVEMAAPVAGKVRRLEAWRLGLQNPRGLTGDPTTGELFILEGDPPRVVRLEPDVGQGLEASSTVGGETIALSGIELSDGETATGFAFNPNNGHLYLLDAGAGKLHEVTTAGQLVATRDLASFALNAPQGMVFAPSGDLTDDPMLESLYLLDQSLTSADGSQETIVEFALAAPAVVVSAPQNPSTLTSSLLRTILTSQFVPPSPDPAGLAFDTVSENLVIADSEVDEMSIFTGINVFIATLSGSLVRTATTIGFSSEPAGVALNPVTGDLYISHDSAGRVFKIDRGSDGQYLTSDDSITFFDTHRFGSYDPEGVACDGRTGEVFIADGVNSEVYRVAPGLNRVFDGPPPQGDDQVSQFDTTVLGVVDPEGIEFNPENSSLYLVGDNTKLLVVTTTDGQLLQNIDISAANARVPAGLAVGPSSRNPAERSIYISDRGVDNGADPRENDGKVYEMSLASLDSSNLPPVVDAGPDLTIVLPATAPLHGTVSDDGVPGLPSGVTTLWSQVSGPGLVTFANAAALDTVASFVEAGIYRLRLSADDGALAASDTVNIVVEGDPNIIVTEVRVDRSSDDAEQKATGTVSLNSSDLELVEDGGIQVVGMRFNNLQLPPASHIVSAYVLFQANTAGSVATSLTIQGESTDNAVTFTKSSGDVASRPRTGAAVNWAPLPWTSRGEAGPAQRTPDLASIIQEIVNRPGWTNGNALALIVTGTGKRTAESWDGNHSAAPLLHIGYEAGSGTVDADPPIVTSFAVPASSATLTVPIDAFTATDNVGVSGYLVNTSNDVPALNNPLWSASAPTSFTVATEGSHTLFGWARDAAGNISAPLSRAVEVSLGGSGEMEALEVRVAASADDAEERPAGNVSLNSSDLELVDDGGLQTVGLRFNGVPIPPGAIIAAAYLQFQVDETSFENTSLTLQGQAVDNAAGFTTDIHNLSARPRTGASVPWTPPAWTSVGEAGAAQRSPNVASVIQEIVGRPGWRANNSLAMVIDGSGKRVAESYDGSRTGAPLLLVQYYLGEPDVIPPQVTTFDLPAESSSLTVTIDAFVASDNIAVSDYLVTASDTLPAVDDVGWSAVIPTSFRVSGEGSHTLYGWAKDAAGNISLPLADTVEVTLGGTGEIVAIEVQVTASADDAEQRPAGNVSLDSSDLELVNDGGLQTVGMRFNSVAIPRGATIVAASLQFQVDETSSEETFLTIQGQASDNAPAFSQDFLNISSRSHTQAAVSWAPPPWDRVGEAGVNQSTPNIASVVQEIVSRPGWNENNSLTIIITGSGRRVAEAYDGSRTGAPLLQVQYSNP